MNKRTYSIWNKLGDHPAVLPWPSLTPMPETFGAIFPYGYTIKYGLVFPNVEFYQVLSGDYIITTSDGFIYPVSKTYGVPKNATLYNPNHNPTQPTTQNPNQH